MSIKQRTIEAIKELVSLKQQEEEIVAKRLAIQARLTDIAVEDFRAWNERGEVLVLGEDNYINIDGTVYLLEFRDNLEFHRLQESSATHF